MTRNQILFFVCLSLLSLSLYSQTQSPNAASMANSGGITGAYTGRPDISFPITTLSGRSINLPISLSYNASGVKVEDVGSWVGLGWNLSAGGAITRTVRGLDDLGANGYITGPNVPVSITSSCESGGTDLDTYIGDVITGNRDAEPDMFNISFPGFSSQFFLTESGEIYTIPRSPVKINRSTSAGKTHWTVTDPNGYIYHFGYSVNDNYTEKDGSVETGWMLRQIQTPVGETVNFTYTSTTWSYDLLPSERYEFVTGSSGCSGTGDEAIVDREISLNVKLLSQVSIGSTNINFVTGPRCDVYGGAKLERITYKEGTTLIKEFLFNYACDQNKQRLWLMGMRELGKTGDALPPLRFEYFNKDDLPGIRSYAQDYWGFYNGQISNIKLTPSFVEGGVVFAGGNRAPHDTYVKYGTLSQVTMPSGGTLNYSLEPNKYDNYENPYPQFQYVPHTYQVSDGNRSQILSNGSTSFSISNSTYVTFNVYLDALGYSPTSDFEVRLTGPTNKTWLSSANQTLLLSAGSYTLIADIDANDPDIFLAEATVNYSALTLESTTPGERSGGGIRIASITTNDGTGNSDPIVTQYDYELFSGGTGTSGKLMTGPVHHYKVRDYCNSTNYVDYLILSSESAVPLSTSAAGSYVGYSQVTVFNAGDNSEGKTQFTFQNFEDPFVTSTTTAFGDQIVPYIPANSYGLCNNGLLAKKTVYRYFGGTFYKVREEMPVYDFPGDLSARGLVIADIGHVNNQCSNLIYGTYYLRTRWIQTSEVLSTTWDGNGSSQGSPIATFSENSYHTGQPWLIKTSSVTNIDGKYQTEYQYPANYNTGVYGGVLESMIAANMVNTPVQVISRKLEGGTTYTTGATTTVYSNIAGKLLPTAVYQLELSDAITGYTYSAGNPLNDSRYKQKVTYSYDGAGNLVETSVADSKTVNMRGYEDDMVVAEIANADLDQVAYNSFESHIEFGNWTYDHVEINTSEGLTGDQCYEGSPLTATVPTGNYVVSMWSRGNSDITVNGQSKPRTWDWEYFEWNLFNVSSITVTSTSGSIDELRLHPIGALMTTYTYEPGIGITAMSGPDGRLSFIEYDEFNRRSVTRDLNKHITSTNNYDLSKVLHGMIVPPSGGVNFGQSQQWTVDLGADMPSGITFSWDFGDGTSTQSGQTVNHTFNKLGVFGVKVTLSKSGYSSVTEYRTIRVIGTLQGSFPTMQTSQGNPLSVTLQNTDKNPPGTTYQWSYFGTKGISFTYPAPQLGYFPVSVTVSHPDYTTQVKNGTMIVTGTMLASWNPPTGNILLQDQSFNFASTQTSHNPPDATYSWTFEGNGTGSGASYPRSFATAPINDMTVTLTVSRSGYTTKSQSYEIDVDYPHPVITASSAPLQGKVTINTNGKGKKPFDYVVQYIGTATIKYDIWDNSQVIEGLDPGNVQVYVIAADGKESNHESLTVSVAP